MSDNYITPTSISGLVVIERPTFPDDRGFFRESIRIPDLEQVTQIPFHVAQANHARSPKDILRGIHIAPWNKLIYVVSGKVQSVIVDLRKDSPTFGKYETLVIGDENRKSVFIPKGCGNSYLVLSDEADYTYLTDELWSSGKEIGIAWNDQTLNITWESTAPVLSEKDKQNMSFEEYRNSLG